MNELTDKERIFLAIIKELYSTLLRCGKWGSIHYEEIYSTYTRKYVHFANWDKPEPGDLVLATTGCASKWKIGWYVKKLYGSMDGAVIREIGTNNFCNYSNEQFIPIKNMRKLALLEGEEYKFYVKVLKAFRKGDEYWYRFGGLDFNDNKTVNIWIREAFGGMTKEGSEPFSIIMKWNKKTTIKSILKTMYDGGYGTYKFKQKIVPDQNLNKNKEKGVY